MNPDFSSKSRSFWAVISVVILLQVIMPVIGHAALLATGERDSDTYRLGYAISSIMTLKSQEETTYFEVIPSNEGDDGVKLLQDKVSDFALVDSAVAASVFDDGDLAKAVRGLIVVRRPQDPTLLLLTRSDVAEDDVVDVTKAIFDHLDILALLHEPAAGIEAYTEIDDHPFPIHPGAASYFAGVDERPPEATADLGAATTSGPDPATASKSGHDENGSAMSSEIADLSEQLNLVKMERNALVEEVDSARVRQTSIVEKLKSVEQELETVTDEREWFSDELAAAKARLDTIEFQELSQANDAAREMRLRAEQSEERYRKAVDVAQSCVEAQTGHRDNAFEALVQIEQLEAEVMACRAARNSEGN